MVQEKTQAGYKRFAEPPGEPFWGNVRLTTRDPLPYYSLVREKYGDYIKFSVFPAPFTFSWYHLTHPSAAEQILQKHQQKYAKGEVFLSSVRLMAGENLFSAEGDSWLRRRRLYQPVFHRNAITRFSNTIASRCDELLIKLHNLHSDTVIDLHKELVALTLKIVSQALFSSDLGEDAPRFTAALRTVLKFVNYKMNNYPFTPPLWLPLTRNLQYKEAHAVLISTVKRMIAARRSRTGAHDMLDILMQARDEETGLGFSEEDVANEAIILLIAGHDTVAAALTWTFYLLAQNPSEDAKFYDELQGALHGAVPDVEAVEKLPYTRMIFDESMRLYPPAWGQPRQALAEDVIDGYYIPEKAVISLAQWVTHRHPEFWDQPDRFWPERFAPGNAVSRPKFAYFPFGGGSRVCIGQFFGLLEGVMVLATIGQQFAFQLATNKPVVPDATFTLIPKDGLPVRVRKRTAG